MLEEDISTTWEITLKKLLTSYKNMGCEHKWSAPVAATYTYKSDFDSGGNILTSHRVYVSCEKCGEIKKFK